MNRPSAGDLERARRLLAYEDAAGRTEGQAATAAARVYDRLYDRLAPLVGAAGVQLLFLRSAKLTQRDFSFLAGDQPAAGSAGLRERLQLDGLAVSPESAEILFATFLALITTFIGERLTTQVLRGAWPSLGDADSPETKT